MISFFAILFVIARFPESAIAFGLVVALSAVFYYIWCLTGHFIRK